MLRQAIQIHQAGRELKRLIHPRIVISLRFGAHVVPNGVVYAILAFIFIYFVTVVGITFVLMISGLELVTAFSAVIAWINNMGPGLNEVGPAGNFAGLTAFQKWVGVFTMLAFWRK